MIHSAVGHYWTTILGSRLIDTLSDLQIKLIIEGNKRFKALIEESGGVYTIDEVRRLLNIDATEVYRLWRLRQILAYPDNDPTSFPKFQFTGNKIVLGLSGLMSLLPRNISGQGAILFFLSPIGSNSCDLSPLDRLKSGDEHLISVAKIEAENYLQQIGT